MNRLPGGVAHTDAEGFLDRSRFVVYLQDYARAFAAPIVEGVDVKRVERLASGFHVVTNAGEWLARSVVVATGDANVPHVPLPAPHATPSLHAAEYRRPDQLPDGPVLIVGGGASGQQLAAELRAAGREIVLSVGRHSRAPRRYRGRDVFEWLCLLGDFDRTIDELPDVEAAKRVPLFPLSGANGGEDLGLDLLASRGIAIAGRLTAFDGTRALFADDLEQNVAKADGRLHRLLNRIDAHPLARGTVAEVPEPVTLPVGPMTLDVHGLGAIVWATGYRRAYPWLHVPVLNEAGEIVHTRGVTRVPGLYVLGLAYQHRRSSHFIGGVGEDAAFLAELLAPSRGASRAA
jgi:putative flavoprotein involved in K+ transport